MKQVNVLKPMKYTALFISLLGTFVIYPFVPNLFHRDLILGAFVAIVILSSLYSISNNRKNLLIALVLAVPSLILSIVGASSSSASYVSLACFFKIFFLLYIILLSLFYFIKERTITKETILGAISIYLLMTLLWAHIFNLLEILSPGSFQGFQSMGENPMSRFLYFSIVTQTTLGYGDVTPLTLPAQILSGLEAMLGQLYLTILIARLIGLHIIGKNRS